MGIYRTYFDKNNTIVYDSFLNTGRNPVSELYFGDALSRFLFFCDFSELKNKVDNKEITEDSNPRHYVKIKNTSNFEVLPYLSNDNRLQLGDNFRPTSFDLELKPVNEFWDEGMGYSFNRQTGDFFGNRSYSLEASNWFFRTQSELFSFSGAVEENSTVIATQHFDNGNEDVFLDVTDYVNDIIFSGATNEGFCLKYTDEFENMGTINKRVYALGLFTRHTQTFFEPFIETVYDDLIVDDRTSFYQNKENNLYLYVNIDGELRNLDELPTCEIMGVSYTPKQKTKGVYYVTVYSDPLLFDDYTEYNDVWSNLIYNGNTLNDVTLRFICKPQNEYYGIGHDVTEPVNYGISISGINHQEKLDQGEKRKVFVNIREPYTVEQVNVLTNVYYRLHVKQGRAIMPIIDWMPVNKVYNNNNFTIDTSWLIPQIYHIDIKVIRNGVINLYTDELKFEVVNNLIKKL